MPLWHEVAIASWKMLFLLLKRIWDGYASMLAQLAQKKPRVHLCII